MGDDIRRGIIVHRCVRTLDTRERNLGAFALDESIQGEIGGPRRSKVERTAVGGKTDLMGSQVSERSRCFALYLGFALKFFAYYGIRSDFAPRLSQAFALLLKDVFESVIKEFATRRFRQLSHGFIEWSIKHAVRKLDSISLCNFQHLNLPLVSVNAKYPNMTLVSLGKTTNLSFSERLFKAPIAR